MFNLFAKINNNDTKINENKLFKKYGNCKKCDIHINLLIISDTHGLLKYKEDLIDKIKNIKDYDLCCILGDVSSSDYEIILKIVSKEKIVAILGNHDEFELLEKYDIVNLNGKIINYNGLRIGGIQGSYRYKSNNYPSFTHKESIKFMKKMDYVDILLSHSGPYLDNNLNPIHNGLKGITEFLYRNKIPYNIHGHNHTNIDLYLKNGTQIYERYLISLIEI